MTFEFTRLIDMMVDGKTVEELKAEFSAQLEDYVSEKIAEPKPEPEPTTKQ